MVERLILLAAVLASPAQACDVTAVHDGDTLTVRCESRRIHIRLTEIDAPEIGQPHAHQSTRALSELCLGQTVEIRGDRLDRYGRTLARVSCRGVDASSEQVRHGHAWAFDRYLTDAAIKGQETEARAARRGLWDEVNPLPPWEFRLRHKAMLDTQ